MAEFDSAERVSTYLEEYDTDVKNVSLLSIGQQYEKS